MNRDTIAIWGTVKLTYDDYILLAVWHNGRLIRCNLSVEKAQETINKLAGEIVW